MESFFEILTVLVPVVVTLGLGWFSRRAGIINDKGIAGLKALVMNFTLPAVLFNVFYTAQFTLTLAVVVLCVTGCCFIGFGLGFLLRRLFPKSNPFLPYLTTGFETGMLGYGLYLMLFPADQLFNVAMIDLGQACFMFSVYITLLNMNTGLAPRAAVRKTLSSPMLLGLALGLVFGLTGLGRALSATPAGAVVAELFSYISAPTGMLMIFVVGYGLQIKKGGLRASLLGVLARSVVMALLCVLFLSVAGLFIPITEALFWAAILVFSLPASFIIPLFTQNGEDEAYVSTALSFGSLLAIVVFGVITVLR